MAKNKKNSGDKNAAARKKGPRKNGGRLIPFIIGAAALALCAGAATFAYFQLRPLRASLIGLDAAEKAAVERVFAEAKVRVVLTERPAGELDRAVSALIPDDLVFSRAGLETSLSRALLAPVPAELAERVPQSVAWSAAAGDGLRSLPILVDHLEVAWRFERWAGMGLEPPLSDDAFRRGAAAFAPAGNPAILFAGGDDETLLLVLSALCASFSGAEGYRKAAAAVADWAKTGALEGEKGTDALFEPDSPLAPSIAALRNWKAEGWLHPEWANLSPKDVRTHMDRAKGGIVLETLSFHRTVPYRTIVEYRSGLFPSFAAVERPALVSPLTVVSVPSRCPRAKKAFDAVALFSRQRAGYALAETSGRASAFSAVQAPDMQAADALAWAAGHRVVVSGLYRDSFAAPARAAVFARALRGAVGR